MKRTIKIREWLVIAVGIAPIIACTSYLDKRPENSTPTDQTDYLKTENMVLPANGLYGKAYFGIATWKSYGMIIVRGDDVGPGGDQQPLIDASQFKYDNTNWMLNATMEETYQIAIDANSALVQLEKYASSLTKDTDKALNKQYVGEVRTLRAFCYFVLTRLWGDIPLVRDNNQVEIGKTPQSEVLDYLSQELKEAADVLPAIRPNEVTGREGSVTKFTALAIKAEVDLLREDWNGVLNATNEIIQSGKFELYSNFAELFQIPAKLCNESLFEFQFTDFGQASGDVVGSDQLFVFQGPNWTPKVAGAGGGWNFITPTLKYINFMIARNERIRLRTTVLFTPDGIAQLTNPPDYVSSTTTHGDVIKNSGRGLFFNGKAYTPSEQLTPGRTQYGSNNNFRVIRYAEVLLMYAEAKLRGASGGTLSADQAVNLVRKRAGLNELSSVTLEQLMDERLAELGVEWGWRYTDLLRTDKAKDELTSLGFVKGQSEYYPIPLEQIDKNPLLK